MVINLACKKGLNIFVDLRLTLAANCNCWVSRCVILALFNMGNKFDMTHVSWIEQIMDLIHAFYPLLIFCFCKSAFVYRLFQRKPAILFQHSNNLLCTALCTFCTFGSSKQASNRSVECIFNFSPWRTAVHFGEVVWRNWCPPWEYFQSSYYFTTKALQCTSR